MPVRPSRRKAIAPLVLATMATQASIVVLVPIVVEVGRDLGASVSAVGQARTILAATAVVAALVIGQAIDRVGVRPLLLGCGTLVLIGALASAAAPSLGLFFAAQVPVGAGVACLLSAGFAGVAAFFEESEAPWAMGYVVGSQSIAWIVGTPLIGVLSDFVSWRLAYAFPAVVAVGALAGGLLAPRNARAPRDAAQDGDKEGVRAVARDPSARRWALAELVAYSAWTAELTYAGAFYVQTYGSSESTVGFLLAVGSFAFIASTLSSRRIAVRTGQRTLAVAGALGMGALLALILNVTPSVWFTLGLFLVMAFCAGLRTTGSSVLGLSQLPARPGSMMAARTASAQLGYMVGALAGGAVLAVSDFGTLGFVLMTGMALSALLMLRVTEGRSRAPAAGASGAAHAAP